MSTDDHKSSRKQHNSSELPVSPGGGVVLTTVTVKQRLKDLECVYPFGSSWLGLIAKRSQALGLGLLVGDSQDVLVQATEGPEPCCLVTVKLPS